MYAQNGNLLKRNSSEKEWNVFCVWSFFFFSCSRLICLFFLSRQISGQHIIWRPERFYIQRKSGPDSHLRGSSLHLVSPAGPPGATNLDPLGTLAKRESPDGPGGLAKPPWVERRRRLAAVCKVAHAGGDAGGASVCVHPRGGWGRIVPGGAVVPGPANQRILSFRRTFPEPRRTKRICSHTLEEMLLWILHRPAGETGGGHGLHLWPLHRGRWEIRRIQKRPLDGFGWWSAKWRRPPGSDVLQHQLSQEPSHWLHLPLLLHQPGNSGQWCCFQSYFLSLLIFVIRWTGSLWCFSLTSPQLALLGMLLVTINMSEFYYCKLCLIGL